MLGGRNGQPEQKPIFRTIGKTTELHVDGCMIPQIPLGEVVGRVKGEKQAKRKKGAFGRGAAWMKN